MPDAQSGAARIEIIENLAAESLHAAAWAICMGRNWYFGNRSTDEHSVPFWKMDLDGAPVFDAIWEAAQARCEELTGAKLRVIRQYANGHTYGLGGQLHRDDERPGSFTLLYYPMYEWKPEWQGETVFDDGQGEILLSVMPKPNRAVLFDARIPHAGRAPSRSCPELRVTVAFKLETVGSEKPPVVKATASREPVEIGELEREGARRVYGIHAGAGYVAALVNDRLQELGKTIRLPGFRAGRIPLAVLESRYGARTRGGVIDRIGNEAAERLLVGGGLPDSLQLSCGAESGDVGFRLAVTHLPDLPDVDCESWELERLTASDAAAEEAGMSADEAGQVLADDLHRKILDRLHASYSFPVAGTLVEREFEAIRKAAEAQPGSAGDQAAVLMEFREIAERRVRLGAVIAELARRHRLRDSHGDAAVEGRVIDWLISRAQVKERPATSEELRSLSD